MDVCISFIDIVELNSTSVICINITDIKVSSKYILYSLNLNKYLFEQINSRCFIEFEKTHGQSNIIRKKLKGMKHENMRLHLYLCVFL